ncbi:MAG: hemolysin family protein [Nitrospinota bacterium]|nr:hemolysin family protein [Nitrospinota bacterium]
MTEIHYVIIAVAALLLLEGMFSGSELGLASLSKPRLRHLAEQGAQYARILEELLKSPPRIFGTTSIGTNLCVFASSAVMTWYMVSLVGDERADFYSFLIIGPLTLILGEIVPKMIFRKHAALLFPFLARPLRWAQTLFTPVLAVTTLISKGFFWLFLRGGGLPADFMSREELLLLTQMSHEKLQLDTVEKRMLDRIFDFKSSDVQVAMRPLGKVVAVVDSFTIEQARATFAESGYSRLPVFHDRIFNITGVISAFDLLRLPDNEGLVTRIMTPAYYVPDTKRNSRLLEEMQKSGVHLAVVVDEYGSAVGIVTQEDLIEEIVGEIEDEYDTSVKSYESLGDGRYIVDAGIEVDRINEELGFNLPVGDYETLAGFLIESLERIPRHRERMAIGDFQFTVLEATQRKVVSVEVVDMRGIKIESSPRRRPEEEK